MSTQTKLIFIALLVNCLFLCSCSNLNEHIELTDYLVNNRQQIDEVLPKSPFYCQTTQLYVQYLLPTLIRDNDCFYLEDDIRYVLIGHQEGRKYIYDRIDTLHYIVYNLKSKGSIYETSVGKLTFVFKKYDTKWCLDTVVDYNLLYTP